MTSRSPASTLQARRCLGRLLFLMGLLVAGSSSGTALAAVNKLSGPVEGDANGAVSLEIVVEGGTPKSIRNLSYRNLDAYCRQDDGSRLPAGEISGDAGANQASGIDRGLVHWISYPPNPSRQVTMVGTVNSGGTHVRAQIDVFNNEFCANAKGRFTATGQRSAPGQTPAGVKLQQAISRLEGEARERAPKTFGGLWVDRRNGRLDINIAFSVRPQRKVATLARGFPRPRLLDAVKVKRSLRVLQSEQRKLVADRERFRGQPSPFPGVAGAAWDLDIDIRRNALVVMVENPSPQAVQAIKARYGSDVIVRGGGPARPDTLYPCATRFLCYSLRSGLKTAMEPAKVGPGTGGCSTAFGAHMGRVTKRSTMGILSAAHCGDPDADLGSPRFHAQNHPAQYGTVYREQQSGPVDAEWHRLTSQLEPFSLSARIFVNDNELGGKVRDVGEYDELVVGYSEVCKSGWVTGFSCGTVLSKNASPDYVSWSSQFVRADYCSEPGDSGAGVYTKIPALKTPTGTTPGAYKAVGIHSGGPELECPDWPGAPHQDTGVFGHIEFAQKALRVKVLRAAK